MVEIEIGVLRGQCNLDRRIGEREFLVSEIDTWQRQTQRVLRTDQMEVHHAKGAAQAGTCLSGHRQRVVITVQRVLSPITANQFSARPLLYAFGSASTAFRYVTLSGPHHVDTIFSHRGNGAPRTEDDADRRAKQRILRCPYKVGAVQRSARHGEQLNCNRAELMPELARE